MESIDNPPEDGAPFSTSRPSFPSPPSSSLSPSSRSLPPLSTLFYEPAPSVITTVSELKAVRQSLENLTKRMPNAFLAVDTEFMRRMTYFPQLALIQLAWPKKKQDVCLLENKGAGRRPLCCEAIILDVTAFSSQELKPFLDFLTWPHLLKVFHSARQDCEALFHAFGFLPEPLFDTQTATAMLGYRASMGYESLAEVFLQGTLDKTSQISDWLVRPLTSAQIHYAACDVTYLTLLFQVLKNILAEKGKLYSVLEECKLLLNRDLYEVDSLALWEKFPFAPHQEREAFILKRLMAWREAKALAYNKPRRHIIKDSLLWEISLSPECFSAPYVLNVLNKLGFPASFRKFFYDTPEHKKLLTESLLNVLEQIKHQVLNPSPEEMQAIQAILQSKNRSREENSQKTHNILRKACWACAAQHNIERSFFASRRDIDLLVEGWLLQHSLWKTRSRLSKGWRKKLLKPFLAEFPLHFP